MSIRHRGWTYLIYSLLLFGMARQNGHAGQLKPEAAVPPDSANRRITLDVVVTDKSGKPIPGLQQQDFTLLDNKLPQKIVSFQAVEGGAATADSPLEVVLVVDAVNAAFTQVTYAREQIEKFLQREGGALPLPVSMAYFTGSGLTMGEAPSRDGKAIIAAIDRNKAGLRPSTASQGFYGALEREQASIKALGQFVEYEVARPGRKLAIWIGPGWPLLTGPNVNLSGKKQQDIFGSIVAFSADLREAGITLYQIDPLGMADAGGTQTYYYKEFLKGAKSPKQVQLGNLALQVFAVQSGGRVFNSNNDVAAEIATCVADANAFYALTFDGLPGDGPNEYHALEVKLGKPGLTVRTRSGYYAQPEPAQAR